MRNLKKVLALVIAFSMMLSVVAFANYADVDKDASYAGAVEVLSALKIFEGDDLGNFNPDNTITRAEAAAVVVRALGLENSAQAAKGTTVFSDVAADNWASGYVNIANQNGIVNGRGDGTFAPSDTVTYEQFVKMMVCALGFEPMASQQGGWPTGYLVVANKYKITSGVSGNDAARKTIAQIVYNAISTPKMDQTSFGTEQTFEVLDGKNDRDYATLLTDRDIYIATGVVGEKSSDKVSFKITEDSDDFEFKADKTHDFNINGTNVMDYKNQNVDVYVYKNSSKDYDVLAVVPSSLGETLTIVSDDVKELDGDKLTYYTDSSNNSKTKTVKLVSGYTVEYNTVAGTKTLAELVDMSDVELKLVENTGDSNYDVVIATDYYSGRVDSVDAAKDKITIDGKSMTFDFDDEDVDIILTDANGAALELADFEEDDVVAVVSDADKKDAFRNYKEYIKIVNLGDNSVTGTVSETYVKNGDDYVSIDGKGYIDLYGLALNDEGTFYIGITGKIIDFDGSAASKNYAYFLECASENKFGKTYQVKLLTEEDGVVTFDLSTAGETSFKAYASAVGIDADDTEYVKANNKADFLVTYKTNASGELKSIAKADVDADKTISSFDEKEYKQASQKLDGKTLEDDVIIFNVDKDKADDVYASDLSFLVDETNYSGYILKDDGDYTVVVITSGDEVFSRDYGFAVATGISYTQDADDQDVVKVTYLQDGEEGTVTIDDDSTNKGKTAIAKGSKFDIGSVFVFNADANGVVSTYSVLGNVANGLFVADETALNDLIKESDDAFYYGYIANTNSKDLTGKKGASIDVNGVSLFVASDANKYTYNDSGRNVIIENDDFLAEDVDVYDAEKDLASFVFVRVVEGDVIDVISFNKRVKPSTVTSITIPKAKVSADSELEDVAPVVPEVVEEEPVVVPEEIDPVVVED